MNLVWHLTQWGFQSGRARIGSRRRWRTIGPVTVWFKPESDDNERTS